MLVGAAAADRFIAWRFGAALLVAIGLQVGVNYLNDYFDGIRGVDTPERVGPTRLSRPRARRWRCSMRRATWCPPDEPERSWLRSFPSADPYAGHP